MKNNTIVNGIGIGSFFVNNLKVKAFWSLEESSENVFLFEFFKNGRKIEIKKEKNKELFREAQKKAERLWEEYHWDRVFKNSFDEASDKRLVRKFLKDPVYGRFSVAEIGHFILTVQDEFSELGRGRHRMRIRGWYLERFNSSQRRWERVIPLMHVKEVLHAKQSLG